MSKKTKKSKEEIIKIVKAFKASNKTKEQWCKEKKMGTSTLYRYEKIFEKEGKNTDDWKQIIVPIEHKEPSKIKMSIGKVNIEIDDEINKESLRQILSVVIELC